MSAWLVTQTHIRALVTFAHDHGLSDLDPAALGDALWRENNRSLAYRYPGSDDLGGAIYAHAPVRLQDPLAVLKQLDCYDYQTCEHPEYPRSPVKELVEAMKAKATELAKAAGHRERPSPHPPMGPSIRHNPAYDAAPWGLD